MKTGFAAGAILLALLFSCLPAARADDLREACPEYAANPDYREVMDFFAYRLKDSIAAHGCGVIPVYYAFGHEKSSDILSFAEDDPQMMNELMDVMRGNEGLADLLAKNPALSQALAASIAENEGDYQNFLARLKDLNSGQLQIISQGKPAAAALAILVPNLPPTFLSKNFTADELDILLGLVSMCALTSASGEAEGVPQLIPYFTTNPNDAAMVYKEVMRAWGESGVRDILVKNAGAVPALVPPLSSEEMGDCGVRNWTPEQFRRMQREYIAIMRDVYRKAAHDYGDAWAREICLAFSGSLAAGLLAATPAEQANIRKFLLAFVGNGEMFRKVFLGSGCFETNNMEALGEVMAEAGAMGRLANSDAQALTALADWHATGRLSGLLQDWLGTTDAKKFSLGMKNLLGDGQPLSQDDALFMYGLINLAMFRAGLAPEQKEILDYLLGVLPGAQQRPALAVAFLSEVREPLFNALKPGRYLNPKGAAEHLVNYGYPESGDPSLYEYFVQGRAEGCMPAVADALAARGSLPEEKLLKHGQTFADRHGGHTVGDFVFAAWEVVDIVSLATPAGAALKALRAAAGRAIAKQAAKRMAKGAARSLAKGAARLPKFMRPAARAGARKAGAAVGRAAEKALAQGARQASAAAGASHGFNLVGNALGAWDTWDKVKTAKQLYFGLGGAGVAFEIGGMEPAPICPEKRGE